MHHTLAQPLRALVDEHAAGVWGLRRHSITECATLLVWNATHFA